MYEDPLTLYKLIVMYMLNRVSFPLSVSQISDFIVERDYTSSLTLNQIIADLEEGGMITSRHTNNRTMLTLTDEGRETLNFFKNSIGSSVRDDVNEFLAQNDLNLRNDSSASGDYYKSAQGGYMAHLTAREEDSTLVDITLFAPTKETAISVCENWQEKNAEIYKYLTDQLL